MSIKGSRHRTDGEDFKKYQEAPYWKKIDNQKALEGKTKEGLKKLNVEILTGLEDYP